MTFPGPPIYSVSTFPNDVEDISFTGEPEARGFVTLPEDEAVRRPRENILEAQVEVALQKYELDEFLPVEDDYHPLASEAYYSRCGESFYISPEVVYSIFQG